MVIAITAVAAVLLAGGGFLAGRATAPDNAEALAEHTRALEAQGATLSEVVEVASRPVVIDAQVREALAQIPPACGSGGDPSSLACMVGQCWQYGQSAAQRPECRAIVDEYLRQQAAGCPEPTE